ncbi:MAG TPA: polysaccharide deacetylase family protein, partial [Candidatus Limnocylindrales bacterium]|nr:polysaccharide deacetylase family protein [Candidatus Limnocylindrales bacterium]
MFARTPASPLRTRRRHALRLLALPIAVVLATSAVTASAITSLRNGALTGAETGPVATVDASPAPDGVAVSSAAPQATPAPTPANTGPLLGRAPRVVHRGSAAKKVVALTFDDGWSATNGRTMVSILLREHVKATFFVNGVWLAKDPELWQSIANAGFVVGNHTYLHQDVTKMGGAEMQRDLQRNARVWEAITGTKMAPLFRPPYGYRNASTDLAAARAGFPDVILWDVDPRDTTGRFTDGQLIHNAAMGRAGSIVLLHVGPDATPRILARVIASYRARGFTFVTVPELLSP